MGKWLQWFEEKISGGAAGGKRVRTLRWLLIVGLCGVSLIILNSFLQVKTVEPDQDGWPSPTQPPVQDAFVSGEKKQTPFKEYEEAYENSLRSILENIVGVGAVDILVTVYSTEEIIVQQDVQETERRTNETDHNGASRQISENTNQGKMVVLDSSGKQQPLIVKTIKPKISGVAIVAEGAENITVQQLIKETVAKGLDVPMHRITVVPRKQK